METEQQKETPRNYLGGSRLGEECARKLQYEYENAPKSRNFKGSTLRIFKRGHNGEADMINWMRLAGFVMVTEKEDGKQLGFYTAKDPQTGNSRISGHYDGIINEAPIDMACPAIWEHKVLGAKGWRACLKHGIKKSKPVYYGQVNTYMAYSGLTENPALFTVMNADTQEIYSELVPFDAAEAQDCTDRGVQVIQATAAGERLPRSYPDEDFYLCKFCDYRESCWELV
jgi:hypothetical protein